MPSQQERVSPTSHLDQTAHQALTDTKMAVGDCTLGRQGSDAADLGKPRGPGSRLQSFQAKRSSGRPGSLRYFPEGRCSHSLCSSWLLRGSGLHPLQDRSISLTKRLSQCCSHKAYSGHSCYPCLKDWDTLRLESLRGGGGQEPRQTQCLLVGQN